MVERQIVDLVVVGSNPITHPFFAFMFLYDGTFFKGAFSMAENALVAQLDRATDFESVGRTFEPCRAHTSFCLFFTITLISFFTKTALQK